MDNTTDDSWSIGDQKPTTKCPVHGPHRINIYFKLTDNSSGDISLERNYCGICLAEAIDKLGVPEMQPIEISQ